MEAQKLGLSHLPETLALVRLNICSGPRGYGGSCGLSVHAAAYDLADNPPQGGGVLESEGIGLAERLPHGGISFGGSPVRPDEHLLQKFDLIQFVNPENGLCVKGTRNIGSLNRRRDVPGQLPQALADVRQWPARPFDRVQNGLWQNSPG
jgi:hypothetical protein